VIVIPYKKDLLEEWDDFVINESENGTIFHLQKFLSYHPKGRFHDCSVLIKNKKKKIVAVFPSAIEKKVIISHPGSTYGGIVIKKYLKLQEIEEIYKAIIKFYSKKGFLEFGLKIIISENFFRSNDKIELFLLNSGMKLLSKEISVVIDVDDFFQYKGMRRTTKQIIKSDRLQELEHDKFLIATSIEQKKQAYNLIYNNLKNKYNKNPTHSFDELMKLEEKFPDSVYFFIIERKMEIVSTYVCFQLNKDVMHTFYIAKSKNRGTVVDVGLILYIMEYLKKKNIKFFNFGISSREKLIKYWIHNYKEQFSKYLLTRNIWRIKTINMLEV